MKHVCADYLFERRGFAPGDTIFCECRRLWTLIDLTTVTFWQMVASWSRPLVPCVDADRAWQRNRKEERADRRVRAQREREWRSATRRPCRNYDPSRD